MRLVDDEKGRRLCVHQTDLNRFRSCPEKARLIQSGVVLDFPGPEAMRGILAHAAINHLISTGNTDEALMAIQEAAEEEAKRYAEAGIENPLTEATLLEAEETYELWVSAGGLDLLPPGLIESECEFEVPTGIFLADGTPVRLRGSMDVLAIEAHEVDDWKFSASNHWTKDKWKHMRYDCQPSIYNFAAAYLTDTDIARWQFVYKIINPNNGNLTELDPIRRTQADASRLLEEIRALVRLIDTNPDGPWPIHPTDWHCSPKWCAAYAAGMCMGAHQPWPEWAVTREG